MAARLGGLAGAEILVLLTLAVFLRARRADYLALLLLCLGGGTALAVTQPIVSLGQYSDYKYYLHAIGVLDAVMPPRRLYAWALAGAPGFEALVWLDGLIAATLPALSYLAALAAGASLRLALASGVALMATAPFLVYAADANPVTPLAWTIVTAALFTEAFLRERGRAVGWVALGLSSVIAFLAFMCREEAVFLTGIIPLSLLVTDRLERRQKVIAVLVWIGILLAAHALLAAYETHPYFYTVVRFQHYSQRLGHQFLLFLATNGLFVALGLVLWNHRHRPASLASPLVLPLLAYTLVYINGAAVQEHQIVVLPLLAPQAAIALQALWMVRRRLATACAIALGAWVVGSTAVLATAFLHDPKQREYAELRRGVPAGSVAHFMPYPAFDADPEVPLLALLPDSVQLSELAPPEGCPAILFTALAWMHERCGEDPALLPRCREVIAQAGPDWSDQALALARLLAVQPGDVPRERASRKSKWLGPRAPAVRGTGHSGARAEGESGAPGAYVFIPYWARPSLVHDSPAGELDEFHFFEATRLALDVPVADVAASRQSLIPVRVRGRADAAAQCQALRQRPAGAALLDLLE